MIDRLEREHANLAQQLAEAQEKISQLGEQVLAKQLEIDANNARIQVVTDNLVPHDIFKAVAEKFSFVFISSNFLVGIAKF